MQRVLQPPTPKKPIQDISDELSKLFDDGTVLESEGTPRPEALEPQSTVEPHSRVDSNSTVERNAALPWNGSTVERDSTVEPHSIVEQYKINIGVFLRIPHAILDNVFKVLDPYDQAVLLRLYRLSRGFNSETCKVGYETLGKALNMSGKKASQAIEKLIGLGFIERLETVYGGAVKKDRGSVYRMMLPGASTLERQSRVEPKSRVERHSTVEPRSSYKEKALKENTQTQEEGSVGVRSRYSLAECRRYAESLKGQGITNPGGYAKTIHRTGEDDEFITEFLGKGSASSQSASGLKAADPECPLCHGSGLEVVKGKGARKCACRIVSGIAGGR